MQSIIMQWKQRSKMEAKGIFTYGMWQLITYAILEYLFNGLKWTFGKTFF